MRTLLVVLDAEVVEAPLLADEVRPGGASRLVLEGAMEALMPSVLLGVARLDQLGRDTETDPPHREPRDPPDRLAGERRAVVAADDRGEPVFAEGPFQSSADAIMVGTREALADQEIPAEAVHDRQWVAVESSRVDLLYRQSLRHL